MAKLTVGQVVEIRERYAVGNVLQSALAKEFGVEQTMISGIVRGKKHSLVEGPLTAPAKFKYRPKYGTPEEARAARLASYSRYHKTHREKMRSDLARWRSKNTDRIREYNQRDRLKHSDRRRAYDRARGQDPRRSATVRYRANPEHGRSLSRAWRHRNPGRVKNVTREWRLKNRERVLALKRASWLRHHAKNIARQREKWRRSGRARTRERYRNDATFRNRRRMYVDLRRARQLGAPVIEPVDRYAIYERDGGRCHICHRKVSPKSFTLDHLVALINGGEHAAFNLAVAHRHCNARKNRKRLPVQVPLALSHRKAG